MNVKNIAQTGRRLMDKDKEKLINLVREFAAVDLEGNDTNDILNELTIKISDASEAVYGEKITMDFGSINAIFHATEEVIQNILDYEKES